MKRGEIWTVAAKGGYASKPRPAVIVQSDLYDATASVTICIFTTDETDDEVLRPLVEPSARNGLQKPSRLMVDKMTTVPRERLGRRIGELSVRDMNRLERGLLVFLGIV